jgi:hypothetical protein
VRGTSRAPHVELHCHTNFSFLDGASHPEELVEAAYQLGLDGLSKRCPRGLWPWESGQWYTSSAALVGRFGAHVPRVGAKMLTLAAVDRCRSGESRPRGTRGRGWTSIYSYDLGINSGVLMSPGASA